MDLTPRTTDSEAPPPRRKRRWMPLLILALALIAGGVVVTKFLTNAIDYYCNVDEVGNRSGCEGNRRIRVQGLVEGSSLKQVEGDTRFTMSFNGVSIPVVYAGDPGGIFQECIPVVAHGRVVNGVLESDRIEVKHSNSYEAKNAKRIEKANAEAAECTTTAQ